MLILLEEFQDITFGTIKLWLFNCLKMDDKVEVLPYMMILLDVDVKAFPRITIHYLPVNVTYETSVLDVIRFFNGFQSQLCKRINDDTEDNVQQDCDDDQEDREIEDSSEVETLDVFWSSCLRW